MRANMPELHPRPLPRLDLLPTDILPGFDAYERTLGAQTKCYDESISHATDVETHKAIVSNCLANFVDVTEGLLALLDSRFPGIKVSESDLGTARTMELKTSGKPFYVTVTK